MTAALALWPQPARAQYSYFGQNKVRYDKFQWTIYHSPHFDVYYDKRSEALLQKVVSFAESAYDQLSRDFDHQIKKPTPLLFFRTHSAFEQNNVILNFIPEGVGAFASPARNRMVLPVDEPDPELMRLILHELTHIFQYEILFQGSLSRAAAARPPQWLMEGMASYMAQDEESHDRMVLRDAVVNDAVPSVSSGEASGYFAYRFGHAVFDYIEERWGREGFLDFVYEFRNTLGARPERAVERAFRVKPEDFDTDFRRWLRKKYLKQLVETGEPSDFGRPFRVDENTDSVELSPVASPSGDLVAAFSYQRRGLEISLFDTKQRRQVKVLTGGPTTRYQYVVAQAVTVARRMGSDLAFSPDGNRLAVFARREGGRVLLLFDVLNGGVDRQISMDVEQQFSLAWSPDGKKIAFSGNREGNFDIYLLDLESGALEQLTKDPTFDGSPAFSPDGKSLVFSSVVGDWTKLYRIDLADPTQRYQLTTGDSNDKDAVYSPDGKRLYFTSDRVGGVDNIFGLDLASGQLSQYTNVVTGCFTPTVLTRPDGKESLVYAGLWKGGYRLYLNELEEPSAAPVKTEIAQQPTKPEELKPFQPAIEVTLDDANKEKYGLGKFFLEDADTYIAVDNNQTVLGQIYLGFSDYLGDRRINAILSSFDALSNYNITYLDLRRRTQWGGTLYDNRNFAFLRDPITGQIIDRRQVNRVTGIEGFLQRPFSLYSRVEVGLGYLSRNVVAVRVNPDFPNVGGPLEFTVFNDDEPYVRASFVNDSAFYAGYDAVAGRRWRVDATWAPSQHGGGTAFSEISADYRQYFSTTLRSGFAVRGFAAALDGNSVQPLFLGGDTIRGFDFQSLVGDRVALVNVEYRFPLLDIVATPILAFRGIRGRVFLDVAAVWLKDIGTLRSDGQGGVVKDSYRFWDSDNNRLKDGIGVYGWGFTVNFLGLDLNWDFSKRWDGRETFGGTQTSFYIGTRF